MNTDQSQYYLMQHQLILKLDPSRSEKWELLPTWIRREALDPHWCPLNQDQANYRVVLFRDEILSLKQYSKRRKRKQQRIQQDYLIPIGFDECGP